MIGNLYKSHRVCGYAVAQTTDVNGRELVVLQTAPHKEEVALKHGLMPVSPDVVAFDVRMLLVEAIEQARFLGLDSEAIAALFAAELERE